MANEIEELLASLGKLGQSDAEEYIKLDPKEIPVTDDLHVCIYRHIYGLLQCQTLSKDHVEFIRMLGNLACMLPQKKGG